MLSPQGPHDICHRLAGAAPTLFCFARLFGGSRQEPVGFVGVSGMSYLRSGVFAVACIGSVVIAAVGVSSAVAASPPSYSLADVGAYGGEPSLVSDGNGRLYDTTPSGGTVTYTSTNRGATWTQVKTADTKSGDDCLATDQANAVYLCNLAGSEGVAPLQADVWKSVNGGKSWADGGGRV